MSVVMHSPVHDALLEVREELDRKGWPSRIIKVSICGESDVRLQVWHPGRPLVVELLGPFDGVQAGDRWQAVRIEPDGRDLWSGPMLCAVRDGRDLIPFVEDLLQKNVEELATRVPV